MLCSRFIKPGKSAEHGRFYQWSENTFDRVQGYYDRTLTWSIDHRPIIFIVFLASLVATVGMFMISKEDFLPSSDTGQIRGFTEAADRTSFAQMVRYQQQAAAIAARDPSVDGVMSSVGAGGARSGVNTGSILFKLKAFGDRQHSCLIGHILCWHALNADEIIQELRPKLSTVPGLRVYMQNLPSIQIGGASSKSQYQYVLQDLNQDELQTNALKLMSVLADARRDFQDVTSDLDISAPAVNVDIDRDKAAALNVTPAAIETAACRSVWRRADFHDLRHVEPILSPRCLSF